MPPPRFLSNVIFIKTRRAELNIPLSSVPTLEKMVDADERIYREVIENFNGGAER